MQVPILDLKAQYAAIKDEVMSAIEQVCESQMLCLGPAADEFERIIAEYCGCEHAIGVSSGTDALLLSFMVLDIRSGDMLVAERLCNEVLSLPVYRELSPDQVEFIAKTALKFYGIS